MQHSIDRTGSEGRRDSGPPTRDTDAWRVLTVQHLVAEDVLDTIVHEGDISRAVGILHLCDVAETAESREQRAESREQRAAGTNVASSFCLWSSCFDASVWPKPVLTNTIASFRSCGGNVTHTARSICVFFSPEMVVQHGPAAHSVV
jgi:hypothetical protein